MNNSISTTLSIIALVTVTACVVGQAQTSNTPPAVSITWPNRACGPNYIFQSGTVIKINANAGDSDGSITQVQFFADTNLIGFVTNLPFSLIWTSLPAGSTPNFKAVAVDNLGASTASDPIQTVVVGFPTAPVFAITSPLNGSIFAAPATFSFSAELLASPLGDTGPIEFFVGTNLVGTVTQSGPFTASTPPYSLSATNVVEGNFILRVKKGGSFANSAFCTPLIIRVTKLGLVSARLSPDSRFEFNVLTSFPTNQHVIQTSSNFLDWVSVSTNVPGSNTFTFTEPSPATNSFRFYRAVVPPQ